MKSNEEGAGKGNKKLEVTQFALQDGRCQGGEKEIAQLGPIKQLLICLVSYM